MRPTIVAAFVPACLLLLACSSSPSGGESTATDGGNSADGSHSGSPVDGGAGSDAPATGSEGGGGGGDGATVTDAGAPADSGIVNPMGLTKVLTGEYATHLLIKGTIYTLSATSYQGVKGASLPPVPIDVPAGTTFIDGQSGLHQSVGADSTGHVWMWGDDVFGDGGVDGTGSGVLPFQIAKDASGNDFGGVVSVTAGDEADGAVKSDGTVWIWGQVAGGLAGDGKTTGGVLLSPTQVPIPLPSGVKAKKLLLGGIGLVLASDGSVWAWGGNGTPTATGTGDDKNYLAPLKLTALPADIVDVALGGSFAYALTSGGDLYGWGYYGLNLGLGDWQASQPSCYGPTTPVLLTSAPAGQTPALPLPHKVSQVVTDSITTHVILTDGTLWGWGDDSQGEVGDGQQLDYWNTTEPFAWDWGQCELPVQKPVQIAKNVTSPWVAMWGNDPAVFYTFAMTADGTLYSWGRNKTGNLGNGVVAPNTQQAAQYPDSWNVLVPTPVAPLSLKQVTPTEAPYCAKYEDAGFCLCPNGTQQGC